MRPGCRDLIFLKLCRARRMQKPGRRRIAGEITQRSVIHGKPDRPKKRVAKPRAASSDDTVDSDSEAHEREASRLMDLRGQLIPCPHLVWNYTFLQHGSGITLEEVSSFSDKAHRKSGACCAAALSTGASTRVRGEASSCRAADEGCACPSNGAAILHFRHGLQLWTVQFGSSAKIFFSRC